VPARRHVVATLGTAVLGSLAGCTADAVTGRVTRKAVSVAVPRPSAERVETTLALLAFEPDRGLVHSEYDPAHLDAGDGRLTVSEPTHGRLQNRFAAVRDLANVVPTEGDPAGGLVDRAALGNLPLGATATVEPVVGEDRTGHFAVRDVTPRDSTPNRVTVSTFDLDERVDRR
jgi:hypothetical protein